MPDDTDFPDPGQVTTTVSAQAGAPPAGPGVALPGPSDDDDGGPDAGRGGGGGGGGVTAQRLADDAWPDPGQDDTAVGGPT